MPNYIVAPHIDDFMKSSNTEQAKQVLTIPSIQDYVNAGMEELTDTINSLLSSYTDTTIVANLSNKIDSLLSSYTDTTIVANLSNKIDSLSSLCLIRSDDAVVANLTGANIFVETLNTSRPQNTYEGQAKTIVISNSTVNQERLGRFTMLTIDNSGNTGVLNLVENTSAKRFKEGDVVGIWVRRPTPLIPVRYTPFGGSQQTITTITGSTSYNAGSIALYYTNNTFVIQNFNDQNIPGVMSTLTVQSIQPQDPGVPFTVIGRGRFVHGLTLAAGDPKFTNGSDHFHLIQAGSGGSFQTLNGGETYMMSRISQHTTATRGSEVTAQIVAAYGASLSGDHVSPPYGVFPETNDNYLAIWTTNTSTTNFNTMTVGKIVYFSVSPGGDESESLRAIGFTAASYPAKIIAITDVGSSQSNADIPIGQTLPIEAVKHFRLQPLNLTVDNWQGAALQSNGTIRASLATPFTNNVKNTGEVLRQNGDPLLVSETQISQLSAKGGYNTVSMRNGCELVFSLTNNPLLSTQLPFLYEGLPVAVLLSTSRDLSAVSYRGLTTDSRKASYGLPLESGGSNPLRGELRDAINNYFQQTYDGYIYRSSPTEVIIRIGTLGGSAESRLQKFESPNIDYFLDRPNIGINNSIFSKSLPPGGLSAVSLNGFALSGVTANRIYGSWRNATTNVVYTLPTIMKGGIEFNSFPPISASDLQLIVYAGNKDPVHRPVAGLQLFSYERYPSIQPELRETGAVVARFALGPSCEGMDRDTAAIGFGSTAYHRKSMAIGHRVETQSENEVAIGVDDSVLRVGLSSLTVSPAMLSSNGVDTFLKIKNESGIVYGLKLDIL
jgi:hypothetical protein